MIKSAKKRTKKAKSTINFLNDFFVQNSYCRDNSDGEI